MSLRKEVFLFSIAIPFANIYTDQDLARLHSPILVSRKDQISNPNTDRPLLLAYSVDKTESETRIVYTYFFSDEDSNRKKSSTERLMARYGRRLDVEWTYAVRLDSKSGDVIERTYQCDAVLGMGHKTCHFSGEFETGTEHPILYDIARHNVFGETPQFPRGSKDGIRYHLDPDVEIAYPKSRDMIPLEHPELLKASDIEIAQENRLLHPSTEYLYLRLRGSLKGRLFPSITDVLGTHFQTSDESAGSLKDMGLDLWGKESVVAIWLPEVTRRNVRIGVGEFRLGYDPFTNARLTLEDIGAYMVEPEGDSYRMIDLSPRIHCTNPADLTTCLL